jgi:hypothetical protein
MKIPGLILLISCFILSCNRIQSGTALNDEDKKRIKAIGLLDEGERINKFYTEYKKDVAGNFFSDKRIASYWIDAKNPDKNRVNSAYYREIRSIDTVSKPGGSYSPYMMITKFDNSRFKVSVNGQRDQIIEFFEEAMKQWRLRRTR